MFARGLEEAASESSETPLKGALTPLRLHLTLSPVTGGLESMSIGISSLPEELLDIVLGCLLPRPDSHLQLHHNIRYHVSTDLLQCRLTCRTWCRVVSPWLFHRLDLLEVYSPSVKYSEWIRKQFVAKMAFFSTCEENAVAVRVLYLDRRHVPEFHAVFTPLLAAQPHFFAHMNNLQILILKYCRLSDVCGAKVFAQILRHPRLHTVVLEGVDGMDWSYVGDSLYNLKNMHVGCMLSPTRVLSLAPCLETLSVDLYPHVDVETISPPWGTLSQLQITNFYDWKVLAESYEAFLKDTDRLSTPLVELALSPCLGKDHIQTIVTAFKRQPLRTLILCGVGDLDMSLFDHIVTSFPDLREFMLLTRDFIHPWAGDVKDYSAILARLSQLQSFTWNNVERGYVNSNSIPELRSQLDSVVTVIGQACPRLTRLKFLDRQHKFAALAHIFRDEKSRYKYHRLETISDNSLPSTSVWYVRNYKSII